MPNQYSSLTAENIRIKMNRKRNPVKSVAQLAREFGYNTEYPRYRGKAFYGNAAPPGFRQRVKALIGEEEYMQIRNSTTVNVAYK